MCFLYNLQKRILIYAVSSNHRLTNYSVCIFKFVRCLEVYNFFFSFLTLEGPWRAFTRQGSSDISLAGSILGSILGSIKDPEGSLSLGEVQQWTKTCSMMFRGFRECICLEKVNTALQELENHKVPWKDPLRPNEGPWLVMDPVGGSSCVPTVPWYDF